MQIQFSVASQVLGFAVWQVLIDGNPVFTAGTVSECLAYVRNAQLQG